MQVWAIIVDSFRETRDKKLFWVLLGLSTLIGASLMCIGFDENGWSFLFGLVKIEDPYIRAGTPQATAMLASIVSDFLIGTYVGKLGVFLCLIGTVGMFPTLMERGAIEVTLSKPVSRFTIFFGKYLGSLIFVLVQVGYFVLFTLVVMRWQLGRWLWAYLWAIPLLVAMFSYIYCVCVLAAIWSRSALTSLIIGMLFWFMIFSATLVEGIYTEFQYKTMLAQGDTNTELTWSNRNSLGKAILAVHTILPNTDDITSILRREMHAASPSEIIKNIGVEGQIGPQDRQSLTREQKRIENISVLESVGGSLLFELVILLIAWWRFQRKDF